MAIISAVKYLFCYYYGIRYGINHAFINLVEEISVWDPMLYCFCHFLFLRWVEWVYYSPIILLWVFLADDPRASFLDVLGGVVLLGLIPAIYMILYGMALRLVFLKLKQNKKDSAILYSFLPWTIVGLFLIVAGVVYVVTSFF